MDPTAENQGVDAATVPTARGCSTDDLFYLFAKYGKIQRYGEHRRKQAHENDERESFGASCLDGFHTVP